MVMVMTNVLSAGQVWGNEEALLRISPQQQAYQTAALVACLLHLGRGHIEVARGLVPALLRGISSRLESPSAPIR